MDEISDDLEGRIYDFRELRELGVRVGDCLAGFDQVNDFNEFEHLLALEWRVRLGLSSGRAWKPLLKDLRPAQFNGRIGDGTALVLPTTSIPWNWSAALERSFDFLFVVGMFSTGRGRVGTITRRITYYRTHKFQLGRRAFKRYNNKESARIAELLQAESRSAYHGATIRALHHLLPGGLPGHGKKR